MAFTSRAPRNFAFQRSVGAGDAVGPGSYAVSAQPVRPRTSSSAPFSSSAERIWAYEDNPTIENPGPGSYGVGSGALRSGGAVPFGSKKKTQDEVPMTPGPGAYDVGVGGERRETQPAYVLKRPTTSPPVRWERYSTPPSIPSFSQSHGWVETPQGRLRPNEAPSREERKWDLEQQDSVDLERHRRRRQTSAPSFGRSSSRPVVAKQKSWVPGPGQYVVPSSIRSHGQGVATPFRSRSKRTELRMSDSPGPGSYTLPSSLRTVSSGSPVRPVVGPTTSHFNSPVKVKSNEVPGPGAYDLDQSSFQQPRRASTGAMNRLLRRRTAAMTHDVAFQSTSPRFAKAVVSYTPGPGAHDLSSSLGASRVQQEGKARFSSSGPRFAAAQVSSTVGPGHYSPAGAATSSDPGAHERGQGVARGVSFKKTAARREMKAFETPPPGAYEATSPPARKSYAIKSPAFGTGSSRFSAQDSSAMPAPGSYLKIQDWESEHRGGPKSGSFGSSVRFGRKNEASLPGPGAYEISKTLERHSFNVTTDVASP